MTAGAIAGAVASGITTPFDVCRTYLNTTVRLRNVSYSSCYSSHSMMLRLKILESIADLHTICLPVSPTPASKSIEKQALQAFQEAGVLA